MKTLLLLCTAATVLYLSVAYSMFLLLLATLATVVAVAGLFTFAFTIYVMVRTFKEGIPHAPLRGRKTANEECVLARYLPEVKGKLPWKAVGVYPTPVQKAEAMLDGRPVEVLLKREDLSSERYGGNKVRNLEFLLGAAEDAGDELRVFGAPGSNQVVAAAVHSDSKVHGLFLEEESDSADNAFNVLSASSFAHRLTLGFDGLVKKYQLLLSVNAALDRKEPVVFPGGANPLGILGPVAAALELFEQISAGEAEVPDTIFLAWGSGGTTAGICLALAIAEWKGSAPPGLEALTVRSVIIHHVLAAIDSFTGGLRWYLRRLITQAGDILVQCGAISPDVVANAVRIARTRLHVTAYWGRSYHWSTYGSHSPHSMRAKQILEEAVFPDPVPPVWICSTFTGKAAACMLDFLRLNPTQHVLLWASKSVVQPLNENPNEYLDYQSWISERGLHPLLSKYVDKNVPNRDECHRVFSKIAKEGA